MCRNDMEELVKLFLLQVSEFPDTSIRIFITIQHHSTGNRKVHGLDTQRSQSVDFFTEFFFQIY